MGFNSKLMKTISCSFLLLMLTVSSAFAATLEEAKAAGQIGEKQDGYIGLVQSSVPADVAALINDVNAQRKERYEQIARENGIAGTPVIVRSDGAVIEGFRPKEFLITWLKGARS